MWRIVLAKFRYEISLYGNSPFVISEKQTESETVIN